MINIKIIGGILFGILVWTLIFNAVEPEITGALISLEENQMVCPEELAEEDFDICFGSKGEVIVNGNLNKEIILELEKEICSIPKGEYNYVNICVLKDFWSSNKMYVTGMGFLNSKTIKMSKILSYAKAGQYIKLLKIVRRFPIK